MTSFHATLSTVSMQCFSDRYIWSLLRLKREYFLLMCVSDWISAGGIIPGGSITPLLLCTIPGAMYGALG